MLRIATVLATGLLLAGSAAADESSGGSSPPTTRKTPVGSVTGHVISVTGGMIKLKVDQTVVVPGRPHRVTIPGPNHQRHTVSVPTMQAKVVHKEVDLLLADAVKVHEAGAHGAVLDLKSVTPNELVTVYVSKLTSKESDGKTHTDIEVTSIAVPPRAKK
jgi:hypothetical protein